MGHYSEWIPTTIKTLRTGNDLTLSALADKSGLSLSYISDIENGRTIPTIETLDKLLTALGATLTLGFVVDYTPPNYVWVSRAALQRLAEVVQDITPEND